MVGVRFSYPSRDCFLGRTFVGQKTPFIEKMAKMKVAAKDKKRYVLKEKRDYQILEKIYKLEKCDLSIVNKKVVNLIRTQLEDDWRTPLLKFLDGMTRKYNK